MPIEVVIDQQIQGILQIGQPFAFRQPGTESFLGIGKAVGEDSIGIASGH